MAESLKNKMVEGLGRSALDNAACYNMVATRCFTYNQATLITDALHGFVIQKTDFPVVYIVIDDGSIDGEQDVLKKWAAENLDVEEGTQLCKTMHYGQLITAKLRGNSLASFVIVLLADNHYQAGIYYKVHEYIAEWEGNAKYLAVCDGDDYWTDPQKLQKQVDILESDDSIGLVHAKAKVFDQNKNRYTRIYGNDKDEFRQIIISNPICHSTTCYRNSLRSAYENEKKNWDTSNWKMGDAPMWLWMSYYSTFHFMDEEVAVYREIKGSIAHSVSIDDRLAFHNSSLEVCLFFADLFHQGIEIKKQIYNSAYKNCALSCIYSGRIMDANKFLKEVPFMYRCYFILFALGYYLKKNISNYLRLNCI